jgi:hypothetical protein
MIRHGRKESLPADTVNGADGRGLVARPDGQGESGFPGLIISASLLASTSPNEQSLLHLYSYSVHHFTNQDFFFFCGWPLVSSRKQNKMDSPGVYAAVSSHYSAVSVDPSKTTEAYSRSVAQSFGYTQEELDSIPDQSNLGLSCGNPLALASLKKVPNRKFINTDISC